jgi:enoyl-CoA hydratase/carnithine racemase
MLMAAVVQFESVDSIAIVTIDRPQQLNAIDRSVLQQLDAALDRIESDRAIGAFIVTGAGRAFCAGADLTELSSLTNGAAFREWIRDFTDVLDRLEACTKPSVAAVDGAALGGGLEIVLACDLRVVSTGARLGLPEIKLGMLPGGGGTQRIIRQVPLAVAKQLLLTGEPLEADDAYRIGLVNAVVPPGEVLAAARAFAESLAGAPPSALAVAKQLVDDGATMPLDAAITLEREAVSHLFDTADARARIQAFVEKRSARSG